MHRKGGFMLRLTWIGHSCFFIDGGKGNRILLDPYADTGYHEIFPEADIITTSHSHFDHANVRAVPGNPKVLNLSGHFEIDDITITGFKSYHDEAEGDKRGENIIYKIELEDIVFCHLGDFGQPLDQADEAIEFMKGADILMLPVGGVYTINAEAATEIIKRTKPLAAIPMHYNTIALKFKLDKIDKFIELQDEFKVKYMDNRVELDHLPDKTEIWIMEYMK